MVRKSYFEGGIFSLAFEQNLQGGKYHTVVNEIRMITSTHAIISFQHLPAKPHHFVNIYFMNFDEFKYRVREIIDKKISDKQLLKIYNRK